MGWKSFIVKCPRCAVVFEELTTQEPVDGYIGATCSKCGYCGELEVDYSKSFPSIQILNVEGWWEHIDTDPIYIRDKNHLKEECEKRGLAPRIALDGYNNPLRR